MIENDRDDRIGARNPMSLYDEIGGNVAISAVVSDYWHRISADDVLSPWFSAVDSTKLRAHLHAYLTVALDGPECYEGRSMRNAHVGLRVTGEAFDLFVARLGETFVAVGVSPRSILRVDARLSLLRPVIVEVEN
jgi:hemoglobin